ncbi:MAG: hypothetical protein K2K72_01750, partial [Duncaniella sp.]|nr:hypothetical protein [Duncaniella sp.]
MKPIIYHCRLIKRALEASTRLLWVPAMAFAMTATAAGAGVEVDGDSPYMQLVNKADSLCEAQLWNEAALTLQHAIASEPDNPGNIPLLSNLGMVHHYMGEDSIALATLSRAIDMAPSSVTILANRAKVYTATGQEQEAFDDYARIMELDSTYIQARFCHGLLALRHRMFGVAQADFDYLDAHFPTADETLIGRATFLSSIGKYAEAIPYYDEILRTIKAAEYYGGRAYCRLMTDDLPEA